MVKKVRITIPELTGKKRRRMYIYLPGSYRTDRKKRFPVLYMFDGHNVFFDSDATYGKSWGMKDYMDATETQLIIVAIECNHSPDNGRLSEYSPFDFSERSVGTVTGRGKITMDWFTETLKPEIDAKYRTIPDREATFIAGSSMGGLMSLYAITAYNHVFSRAAALSPSVWISPEQVDEMILNADMAPDTVVYMDYGAEELVNHKNMIKRFMKVGNLFLKKEAMVTSRIIPGGTHCEASWEKQIPFFVSTLLYD